MAELASALGRDRSRTTIIAIGACAVIAATTVSIVMMRGGASDPCGGADARVDGVWSSARAASVRTALGDAAWVPAAITALDDRRARWTTAYRGVCEATRVRGEQSDTLLDLRMRCLDRALDRFDALAAAVAAPLEPKARLEVTGAIGELPAPEACATLVDAGELALPADAAMRAKAIAARHEIARAWAAVSLARYRDARELGERIERDLQGVDAPGVAAELAVMRAVVEARIGTLATAKPALDRALIAASAANAAELELVVWAARLREELFAGDPARIEELLPLARAAAARAHRDGAELDGIAGEALRHAGRLDDARVHLERARASKDPLRADQRAVIAMNLGAVRLAGGDVDGAEAVFVEAYDLARGALGDGHPTLALYLDKLAAADRAKGRLPEALARHDQSLALRTAAYGPRDRSVATSLLGRARTQLLRGDLAAATADAERARDIRTEVYGVDSPRLGEVELVLADIASAKGSTAEAASRRMRALELDRRLDVFHPAAPE